MNRLSILRGVLSILFTLAAFTFSLAQGVTTASLNGQVTDANGEGLIGANVVAVHQPTGSQYGNATNLEGYFRIPYMKVGGPYKVTITYTGYEPFVKENVYLGLGQSFNLNVDLDETAQQLEGVEVVTYANDIFDGNADGQKTVVDEQAINATPTLSRAIADFARLNPLANINEQTDGFTISLAGQNNRYNSIYIDGIVNNDAFGLAGSGTNGGQTGVQPISLDAIEQFTIAVAPFDIRQSGFAGGAINAITRSGTNELEGSAYWLHRNEDLAGKTPGEDLEDDQRQKLPEFTANLYGARLGGPIVKDKLFFFVNAEIQRDETPQPFDIANYEGNADAAQLDALRNAMIERFGYDPGVYDNNTAFLDSEKFLVKLDWNINNNHRLSLRHNYVNAENLEARESDDDDIRFVNGSEFFPSTTNSTALELTSTFNSNMSNKLTIGATFVRDDRDVDGDPFPYIDLEDGGLGDITLGGERFSTANRLDQDVITITNDFTLYKGRHSALFGVNFEYFNAANLFIRENFGAYTWEDQDDQTGLDRFLAGENADEYNHSFSQVDNVVGDESAAIAEFQQILLGFYVQDEFQWTPDFKLTGGLRIDIPIWPDDVPVNNQFNNETIPAIESFGYDLQGARTGSFIEPQILFSPRLSFNWDITGDNRNQLRGGIGIFTSRVPLVWPGGAYNNYGLNISNVQGTDVPFQPDVNQQPVGFEPDGTPILEVDPENPVPGGQVDLFAEDFKLSQVMKLNLAYDRDLGNGYVATVEGIFTDYINNIRYQNLNLKPSTRNLTGAGPDERPLFNGTQPGFGDDVIDPNYNYIMLASNTDLGYAWNAAVSLTKRFNRNFSGMVSYSYGDAYTLFDGTSSQNNSQWRGFYNPQQGRNFETDEALRSVFAAGHRIFGQFAYGLDYPIAGTFGGRSQLSLNFNAQTGGFFSYVVGARNFLFVDDGGFDNNELIFVPESRDQIPLVDLDFNGQTFTPDQQWEILDSYISDMNDLSDRRGQYAEKNSANEPLEFTMDLRFLQDFYIEMANGKRNTLQFSLDIFNFTNLLNQEWGLIRRAGDFGNYRLLVLENSTGFPPGTTTTPEYTINPDLIEGDDPWDGNGNIDDEGLRSSRWQMQIGVRYIFN